MDAGDIFKCMFEFRVQFHWFVPKDPVSNIPALVQIVAWRRPGDKLLSESMMASLLMCMPSD